MSSRQKCVFYCVIGGLLLIYLAAPGGNAGELTNKAKPGSSERLRELLEERHEILRTIVEAEKRLLDIGQGSTGRIAKATVAMLRAEADLSPTQPERIKIHEEIVQIMRGSEARLAREVEKGLASSTDLLNARLRRLEEEITLEKMKLTHQASR